MSEIPEEAMSLARLTREEMPVELVCHIFKGFCFVSDKQADAIADAQLKKAAPIIAAQARKEVLNWAVEVCPHRHSDGDALDDYVATKRECARCWQDKLKEWGLGYEGITPLNHQGEVFCQKWHKGNASVTKIYLVTSGEYSNYSIDAAFSTREKAQAWIDYDKNKPKRGYVIENYDIDPDPGDTFDPSVRVTMKKDGAVRAITLSIGVGFGWFLGDDMLEWSVRGTDEQRAIKVVNEKRAQILALNIWGDDEKVRELVKA